MGKKNPVAPLANAWLFSCPATMKVEHIAAALGVSGQPVTEFSALHWQDPWQIEHDLRDAYNFSKEDDFPTRHSVNWNAIQDMLFEKCFEYNPLVRSGSENSRFVGELIIIRNSRPEISVNLATLVDCAQHFLHHIRHVHPESKARALVVLAGWTASTLQERIPASHRVAWIVNPLPIYQP